jgi:uncharacterized protein
MSMVLDLRRFRGAVEAVDRAFDPAAFGADREDFRVVAPVEIRSEIRKDGRKFRLVGRVKTTLETACSRCLEPFTFPIDAPFDLLFLPAADQPGHQEQELGQDDVGVSFYTDEQIDLGEVAREQCYLTLPMKPLCRQDCQGLCPVCGTNRNVGSCTCSSEWVDPRLEALRALKPTDRS